MKRLPSFLDNQGFRSMVTLGRAGTSREMRRVKGGKGNLIYLAL